MLRCSVYFKTSIKALMTGLLVVMHSSQLYLEMVIPTVCYCLCILPSCRAEKSQRRRYLSEISHIEDEFPFITLKNHIQIDFWLFYYASWIHSTWSRKANTCASAFGCPIAWVIICDALVSNLLHIPDFLLRCLIFKWWGRPCNGRIRLFYSTGDQERTLRKLEIVIMLSHMKIQQRNPQQT